MAIAVRPVATWRDRRAFMRLPWRIYAGDANWVPMTARLERDQLDTRRHPFWQHGRGVLLLAYRGGEPAGRITAHIDDNYIAHWSEQAGWFGFFECIDDKAVAAALLDAAGAWLRHEGIRVMRGPASPSTFNRFGVLTEGFDTPPVFMLSYNPPYYPALLEGCGLTAAKELLAHTRSTLPSAPTSAELYAIAARVRRNPRVTVRPLDRSRVDGESRQVAEIYNECWARNWGFAPVTVAEMKAVVVSVARFVPDELTTLVCYDGAPVGVSVVVPDLNELFARLRGVRGVFNWLRAPWLVRRIEGCRAVIIGCKPRYRRLGIPALQYCLGETHVRRHFSRIEFSWVLDDNTLTNQLVSRFGAAVYKRYRVYERTLE